LRRLASTILATIFVSVLASCGPAGERSTAGVEEPTPEAKGSTGDEIAFTDVTEEAGIAFVHDNGASERRYLPETMGSGVAFFDADGDGAPDLYFANARSIAEPDRPGSPGALYLNRSDAGGLRFEDVTREAGLDTVFYGLGTAVGDVENDGDLDLFVTGLGGDRLFRNLGGGPGEVRFEDASAELGLAGDGVEEGGFGSSAAFVDVDRDGFLDLYVGRYVTWSRESDVRCKPDGEHPTYCTPEVYDGASNRLYRNLGGVGFEDVTEAAGLLAPGGKTLGLVPLDADGDGWPDLAVANDTSRNALYLNLGSEGRLAFRDAAVELGLAFGLSGAPRGAMGIDAGDLDGDGRDEIVIGNFAQEMAAVYRPLEQGLYRDDAAQLGIGLPTLMSLAFGTLVADLDSGGELDAIFANGHIEPEVARFQPLQSWAQPLQVFRNLGSGSGFEEVVPPAGSPLATPWVGRGLASADADGDGDLDLVLTQNGAPARLLRNDAEPRSFLRIRFLGRKSNRTGYGVRVTAVAGERTIVRTLVSGRSYLSASEPIMTLGLGGLEALDRLEVRWPSGREQVIENPPLGRLLVVEEPGS